MVRTGIVLALLSAVLFGASTPFAKLLLGVVDPWTMAGVLYLGAGIGLAGIHLTRRLIGLAAVEAPLRRSDAPWLALVILTGGVLGPLLLMFGLARTDAAGASLLLNLEGLATMGIAWLVFRENVDRRLLLGAFAIVSGAVVLSWQGRATFELGALMIAGAGMGTQALLGRRSPVRESRLLNQCVPAQTSSVSTRYTLEVANGLPRYLAPSALSVLAIALMPGGRPLSPR